VHERRLPASFRDPSGFVFEEDGVIKRQVNSSYRPSYDLLVSSGLLAALTDAKLLVGHREAAAEEAEARRAYKILVPERIPFVSYPYEWSFGALKDAALATLRVQSTALDHGMSLRDASAYNVQFVQGLPVLIDTLSFEAYAEGAPWIAYSQFCRHFLAPLALMSMRDIRLGAMSRLFIDGIPLDLAAELLPGRTRLRPALQIHLHAHAKSQRRHEARGVARDDVKGRFSLTAFRGLIDSLEGAIRSLEWEPAGTWVDYYAEAEHYSEQAFLAKKRLVRSHLEATRPRVVWDLGANTGLFSRLAQEMGAFTVSFDIDPGAVEANYRRMRSEGDKSLLPLVLDLTNPSPGIGWANRERATVADRGPADVCLALALVHHLAIGGNVPLPQIAEELARLGSMLVIEFVPKGDPKVDVLLSSREDIFADYTREGFERAFGERFEIVAADDVPETKRTMYLMRAGSQGSTLEAFEDRNEQRENERGNDEPDRAL